MGCQVQAAGSLELEEDQYDILLPELLSVENLNSDVCSKQSQALSVAERHHRVVTVKRHWGIWHMSLT